MKRFSLVLTLLLLALGLVWILVGNRITSLGRNRITSTAKGVTFHERVLPGIRHLKDISALIPPNYVGEPFLMMETEVTQELYLAVMGKNPSYFTGDLQRPVENVSWEDGIRFANALSTAMGLEPAYDGDDNNAGFIEGSNGFRYPLVVEWSWAALCGEERQHRYIGSDNRNAVAWWSGNSEGQTHPVGQKQANACGLRDMSGNVMEWVADDSENLGQHRSGAATRYIIGNSGGFLGTSDNCIYQNRNEISPWLTCKDVGLRLVRALD